MEDTQDSTDKHEVVLMPAVQRGCTAMMLVRLKYLLRERSEQSSMNTYSPCARQALGRAVWRSRREARSALLIQWEGTLMICIQSL